MDDKKEVKKTNTNKSLIILVVAIVVSLGAGFIGGFEYQKSKNAANFKGIPNGNGITQNTAVKNGGTTSRNGAPSGSQPVSGEITSIDNTGITIKTPNGGSKIIVFSGSTVFNKTTEGSVSDLKTGDSVMVIGATDSNGTVTAETVSVGVTGLQFQGGMGQPPSEN